MLSGIAGTEPDRRPQLLVNPTRAFKRLVLSPPYSCPFVPLHAPSCSW